MAVIFRERQNYGNSKAICGSPELERGREGGRADLARHTMFLGHENVTLAAGHAMVVLARGRQSSILYLWEDEVLVLQNSGIEYSVCFCLVHSNVRTSEKMKQTLKSMHMNSQP